MALEVGKIFYAEKIVVPYNNLGIGRLIYQLPIPLCQMFMKEVFGEKLPDTFDDETLTTINKFFENNLNVSETSRQLYAVSYTHLLSFFRKISQKFSMDITKREKWENILMRWQNFPVAFSICTIREKKMKP